MQYIAVIGDIIESKQTLDRKAIQIKLETVCSKSIKTTLSTLPPLLPLPRAMNFRLFVCPMLRFS